MTSRRRLLASLAALPAATQSLLARALELPAARRSGTLRDVEHVVVLTQENRSFDHYFGALPGVRGFADPFPVPLPQGRSVFAQPRRDGPMGLAPFRLDTTSRFELMRAEGTPHRWPDAQQAWDEGRLARWTEFKHEHAMAYFAPEDLPFHTALADAFTLCDAYHCSFQGGTWPNRLFLFTGSNDPHGGGGGPALYNDYEDFGRSAFDGGYRWLTYAERLQAAGLRWQVYQDVADNFGDNPLAAFRAFRDAFHRGEGGALRERAASTRALDALREDVLRDRLPQVSWVVATVEGSEHPWRSSPAQGALYTARVLEALLANPAVWARTVLLVNYDENDGFFDHLPPPAPPSRLDAGSDGRPRWAGASSVELAGEYQLRPDPLRQEPGEAALLGRPYGLGPRVPLFVVSPWSQGGWVCSQTFDHTSVIRFLERRFGVLEPTISPWRRAVCGDLTACFDFARHEPGRFTLPAPLLASVTAQAERARALPRRTLPPSPEGLVAPVQAAGTRPARALGYELHGELSLRADAVHLQLRNGGRLGAVVHLYDRARLDAAPRRYTLGPGARIVDRIALGERGEADLWLLGPNGWHRHGVLGAGDAGQGLVARLRPVRRRSADGGAAGLLLELASARRSAQGPRRFELRDMAYGAAPQPLLLQPRQRLRLALALPPHHWYDWLLRSEDGRWQMRWAGHVEDGRASISDPAMHGPALLAHGPEPAPRPASALSRA